MMKNLIVAAVFISSIFGLAQNAFSQNKIGYISTEELIGTMPEAEKANAQLQDYQTSLQQQYQDYNRELIEKDSIFQSDSSKMTLTMRELKRNDLIALYQKLQGYQQQSQQKIQERSQELIVPIRAKAFEAIKAVAKESAYSYVLEAGTVLVGPPGDDILLLVKKKLGIVDKTATPAKPAATKPKG